MFHRLTGLHEPVQASYSSGRMAIWQITFDAIKQHPFTGYGANAYIFLPQRIFGAQPHNIFLQCLLEWGIVGSLFFCGMLFTPFKLLGSFLVTAWNQRMRLSSAFLAAVAILLTLSAQALVDGTWYHGQPCMYLAFAMALALAEIRHMQLQEQALKPTDNTDLDKP